jgi:hypothetical protein
MVEWWQGLVGAAIALLIFAAVLLLVGLATWWCFAVLIRWLGDR